VEGVGLLPSQAENVNCGSKEEQEYLAAVARARVIDSFVGARGVRHFCSAMAN
jgi:hypothetical protein